MKYRMTVCLAAVALLAACGGEGSSPPPTSGPAPAPSPSPTPTPTPIAYTTFANLTGEQVFNPICATGAQNDGSSPNYQVANDPVDRSSLAVAFSQPRGIWTLTDPGSEPSEPDIDYTFGPADIVGDTNGTAVVYQRSVAGSGTQRFSVRNSDADSLKLQYARALQFVRAVAPDGAVPTILDTRCVFGVNTVAEDGLPTGRVEYGKVKILGTAVLPRSNFDDPTRRFDLVNSTGSFAVDFAASQLIVTLNLEGREIRADGSLSSTVTKIGTLVSRETYFHAEAPNGVAQTRFVGYFATDGISGFDSFTGGFFGPKAAEAGLSFTARPDETITGLNGTFEVSGVVLAAR